MAPRLASEPAPIRHSARPEISDRSCPTEGSAPVLLGGSGQSQAPILVTGSHLSGSTWVGKMLGASPALGYIREPFGRHHRPGIFPARVGVWFPYLCEENADEYVRPVSDLLAFRYRLGPGLVSVRSMGDAALVAHDVWAFRRYRRDRARPLLKDPLAVFSAPWLSERFRMKVIMLIRHPAGFASSILRYGWAHPFEDFLHQPSLMDEVLYPFRREIELFSEEPRPLLDQAILLWNLIHWVIERYRWEHPDWYFVRHEDLARDPVRGFAEIYRYLGLGFGIVERRAIERSTARSNPAEVSRPGELRRDSRAVADLWRTRLTPQQIDQVRSGVEPLASRFYDEEDWTVGPRSAASS